MTSSKTKRKPFVLKSSIAAMEAAAVVVMFSLFAAPLISQNVIAQMSTSPRSNNTASLSTSTNTTTTTSV